MKNEQYYIDEIERLRAEREMLIETNRDLSCMIESGAPSGGRQSIDKAISHLKKDVELAKSTLEFALFTFDEYMKHPELLQGEDKKSNVIRLPFTAYKH